MGVSKPVFTCIKTKPVGNAQSWVNEGSDDLKDYYFHFLFASNYSHSKAQFLAERNLRSTRDFYIYIMIYKPFLYFIRIKISICYDTLECWIFKF